MQCNNRASCLIAVKLCSTPLTVPNTEIKSVAKWCYKCDCSYVVPSATRVALVGTTLPVLSVTTTFAAALSAEVALNVTSIPFALIKLLLLKQINL